MTEKTRTYSSRLMNSNTFRELGIFIAFIIVLIVLTILSPNAFARPANLINILK